MTLLALAVGFLIAVPYAAHRLRRRRTEEQPFAAAQWVSPQPVNARRRSKLEDRSLLATRALAILTLACLGASPFVRCSRLSLNRQGGASVALVAVVDDSMSMRADIGGRTRFERAKQGAADLFASAREGDALALVLAGAPPRVVLTATTDRQAARVVLDSVTESDRGTDLEGALTMARALIADVPQSDRRIVLLSDLGDGRPSAAPLGEGGAVPFSAPLRELRTPVQNCGIVRADANGARVHVHASCNALSTMAGREILLLEQDKVLHRALAPTGHEGEITLVLPSEDPRECTVRLTGSDAIPWDDSAPVLFNEGSKAIAVVVDAVSEAPIAAGSSVLEQALAALRLDVRLRPLPSIPERSGDFQPFAGIILEDPPGFTPEQRRALMAFFEDGGVVLLTLGPRASAAPLGASLKPVLDETIQWGATVALGAAPENASDLFAGTAGSLSEINPNGRATLASVDVSNWETLLAWTDGQPLVARRNIGRGEAWVLTLPFAVEVSDIALRPGILALLDAWVLAARQKAAPHRTEVGVPWVFPGAQSVAFRGPGGPIPALENAKPLRLVPPLTGLYRGEVDGKTQTRIVAPLLQEFDDRPHPVAELAVATDSVGQGAPVDVSWMFAIGLLGIMLAELMLRTYKSW